MLEKYIFYINEIIFNDFHLFFFLSFENISSFFLLTNRMIFAKFFSMTVRLVGERQTHCD